MVWEKFCRPACEQLVSYRIGWWWLWCRYGDGFGIEIREGKGYLRSRVMKGRVGEVSDVYILVNTIRVYRYNRNYLILFRSKPIQTSCNPLSYIIIVRRHHFIIPFFNAEILLLCGYSFILFYTTILYNVPLSSTTARCMTITSYHYTVIFWDISLPFAVMCYLASVHCNSFHFFVALGCDLSYLLF